MDPRDVSLGAEDYRQGAMMRMRDAQMLRDQNCWVASIYLGGRAVECIFRSLLWARNRRQEVGHDLKDLLKRVRSLGLLRSKGDGNEDDVFQDAVNDVAVIWRNDLRFTGEARFLRLLKAGGRASRIGTMRIEGDPIKANAIKVLEACETIVARGEPSCRSRR